MTAVIVEDEGLAARNLRSILEEIGSIQVLATLDSISETVEWFQHHGSPDLLFLDIHLADGSAFEIFDHVPIRCPIIFTTAYDEYALKAFSVNSIDYLLKPIDTRSVRRALLKHEVLSSNQDAEKNIQKLVDSFRKASLWKTHFLIPVKGDKLVPLQSGEIACLFIDSGVVKAVTFDARTYVMDHTLDELAGMLNPADFFRANRQYIIARSAVKDIDLWFNSRLSVNLKVTVPEKILISKARVPEFRNWFAEN
jgi:two-component system LytT family response regulator